MNQKGPKQQWADDTAARILPRARFHDRAVSVVRQRGDVVFVSMGFRLCMAMHGNRFFFPFSSPKQADLVLMEWPVDPLTVSACACRREECAMFRLRRLVHVILDRVRNPTGESCCDSLKHVENIDLPCLIAPETHFISRPHSSFAVASLSPVSFLDK